MAKEPLTIQVDPESELARVLAGASEVPVVLDSNGVRYTVNRETTELLAGYSPQRACCVTTERRCLPGYGYRSAEAGSASTAGAAQPRPTGLKHRDDGIPDRQRHRD